MASSRTHGAARALLASTASGLTWGVCDALTKSALNLAGHAAHAAVLTLLTAWQTYACAFTALAALGLAQVAYNAAPLHISLPSLAAAEPIAGVILGVFVLGERFRASPGSLAVESVCAAPAASSEPCRSPVHRDCEGDGRRCRALLHSTDSADR